MLALSALVRKAPVAVIAATVALTAVLGFFAGQLEMQTGQEGFAPDNPELLASETLQERFGSSSQQVVQILVQGDDVISADGLATVAAVTEAVQSSAAGQYLSESEQQPGIVSFLAPVQQGLALTGGDPSQLTDEQLDTFFTQALAQTPADQLGFIENLLPDGADAQAAQAEQGLMLVFLDSEAIPGEGEEQFNQVIEIETGLAEAVRSADLPGGFSAEPFSFSLLFGGQDEFASEIAQLFAAAFGIIILILGFVYWLKPRGRLSIAGSARRSGADILLTMLTIVFAIVWMQGFGALLGPDYAGLIGGLTEVTQIIPVLLIGLGVDYAIHLTTRYREEVGSGATVGEGIERAVRTVGIALVLATLTTVVGFLTNVFNPVPALKDFGVLAAVGILAAFILMLTFVPAVRLLLDRRAERRDRLPREALDATGDRVLPGIMARTAVLAERVPVITLLLTVVVGGGLGAYGLSQLSTEFSFTDFVPDDSPVVQTLETIRDEFGGGFGETTQVLLDGHFATPRAHNALVEAQGELADIENVTTFGEQAAATSPVSVLATELGGGPEGQAAAPDPALAQAAQQAGLGPDLKVSEDADVRALYQALLEAAPEEAGSVLATGPDGALDLAQMTIQTSAGEAGAHELRTALNDALAPVKATGVEAVVTSDVIINEVIVNALSSSQLSSLGITLLAAMVLLVITFWIDARKPLLGVITIAPVALVVLWTFGMMAATGIPFGPVTATISALAIGIGVPYTIHITHRYLEDRVRYPDPDEAIRSTVRHTGGALAGSAFTTMAGFGILVTSSLTPFRQFGLVTVYAIGFALLSATLVLPSMLALWDRWHRRHDDTRADTREPEAVRAGS